MSCFSVNSINSNGSRKNVHIVHLTAVTEKQIVHSTHTLLLCYIGYFIAGKMVHDSAASSEVCFKCTLRGHVYMDCPVLSNQERVFMEAYSARSQLDRPFLQYPQSEEDALKLMESKDEVNQWLSSFKFICPQCHGSDGHRLGDCPQLSNFIWDRIPSR